MSWRAGRAVVGIVRARGRPGVVVGAWGARMSMLVYLLVISLAVRMFGEKTRRDDM